MSTLLVWREKLQKVYAAYSVYILKGLQFLLGLLLFGLINSNVGFMEMASSVFCTGGLAVICTFFPMIVMVIAAAVLVIVHFYALSMPIAIVSLVIFLIMYIFYFRFTPKKAWLLLVSALAFALKIPLIIPVVFGLLGTPVWIVPAACGIISYYMVSFVKASAAALRSADSESMISGVVNFTKQVVTGHEMWLMVMAIVIGILVVNLIRTRAIDHAWKIGSASGVVVSLIIAAAGNIILNGDVSYVEICVSALLGVGLGLVLEFLFFSVDYSRTESIQFEDDEYYYYVKAVPKIGVSVPEKTVKHITEHQPQETVVIDEKAQNVLAARGSGQRKDTAGNPGRRTNDDIEKNTHEILLTRSLSRELGLDQTGEESR